MSWELWAVCEKCDGTGWQNGCVHGPLPTSKHRLSCDSRKVWDCPKFVEVDFDAIWTRYYTLEDRRFLPGLTYNELWFVVYGEKKEEE